MFCIKSPGALAFIFLARRRYGQSFLYCKNPPSGESTYDKFWISPRRAAQSSRDVVLQLVTYSLSLAAKSKNRLSLVISSKQSKWTSCASPLCNINALEYKRKSSYQKLAARSFVDCRSLAQHAEIDRESETNYVSVGDTVCIFCIYFCRPKARELPFHSSARPS